MRQITLAVFAIVAIAAMMGAASVAPAYAAKLEVNTTDVIEVNFPFPASVEICGETSVEMIVVITTKLHMWDTGKVKLHQETATTFTDADGNIIGTGKSVLNEMTKADKLPMSISQENNKFSCTNGESLPSINDHYGHKTTIDKDGNIKHLSRGS